MSGPIPPPPPWAPPRPAVAPSPTAPSTRWIGVGAAAVVVLVVGTFLPWIRSGKVSRNSYELAGVGLRRLDAGPWVEGLLQAWPYLGPLWALVAVLAVLRRRRSAAVVTLVLAVLSGLVALGGLFLAVRLDSPMLAGVHLGPLVTLLGAVGCIVAAAATLRRRRARSDPTQAGHGPTRRG